MLFIGIAMKSFNTTGTCHPDRHYMVDITERLEIIRKMIDKGDYFCINRGRQYGKTTTLANLKAYLENAGYCVFSISFEGVDDSYFNTQSTLGAMFVRLLCLCVQKKKTKNIDAYCADEIISFSRAHIDECTLFDAKELIVQVSGRNSAPIVLLIDEVDQASGYDSFLKLLGIFRDMYLNRGEDSAVQSIILAGVHDIKNLKLKLRPDNQHQYNSPWNISAPFNVDMSLPSDGIANMLLEYKTDRNLAFNEKAVARMIRSYTAGYPFLVSRLCQIIDTEQITWDKDGVLKAVNIILMERNTLFDNMVKKLDDYPELRQMLKGILFSGNAYSFNPDEKCIQIAAMFNYIENRDGNVAVACRLMETRLYNLFISSEENSLFYKQGQIEKSQFIKDGTIDMSYLMERFAVHMNQTYKMDKDNEFIENDARKLFLTYLRPVINGIGSYHIEEQTRNHERMDVVIDYLGKQYVIELKIWRGNAYNNRGEDQLCRYLDYFNIDTGYLLSFCFNRKKRFGLLPPVELNGRTLIEAIV